MKQIFAAILCCSTLLSTAGEALLPPLYESLGELKTLLSSSELERQFQSGEAIRAIQRNEKGFIITSTKHTLQVDVVYDAVSRPGPAQYHLIFHPAKILD